MFPELVVRVCLPNINTSLFSLLFALLPRTLIHPSSVKYISLLGWAAVPTDSWFPARPQKWQGVVDGTYSKLSVERVQVRALWPVGTEAPREVQVRAFGPVGTKSPIFFESPDANAQAKE